MGPTHRWIAEEVPGIIDSIHYTAGVPYLYRGPVNLDSIFKVKETKKLGNITVFDGQEINAIFADNGNTGNVELTVPYEKLNSIDSKATEEEILYHNQLVAVAEAALYRELVRAEMWAERIKDDESQLEAENEEAVREELLYLASKFPDWILEDIPQNFP